MDTASPAPLWGSHAVARGEAAAADAAAVRRAAGERGLTIDEVCLPGVIANLALLGRHAAALDDQAPAQ